MKTKDEMAAERYGYWYMGDKTTYEMLCPSRKKTVDNLFELQEVKKDVS